jgi:hypothetical protein
LRPPIANNTFRFWLKNDNVAGEAPRVWRYAHFNSSSSFAQKRATLLASVRKVHSMASDDAALIASAGQKLAEFQRLQYPRSLLCMACTTMAVRTRNTAWFRIRGDLLKKSC